MSLRTALDLCRKFVCLNNGLVAAKVILLDYNLDELFCCCRSYFCASVSTYFWRCMADTLSVDFLLLCVPLCIPYAFCIFSQRLALLILPVATINMARFTCSLIKSPRSSWVIDTSFSWYLCFLTLPAVPREFYCFGNSCLSVGSSAARSSLSVVCTSFFELR